MGPTYPASISLLLLTAACVEPPPAPVDCDRAPVEALSTRQLDGARGYHGLVIDVDGRMIGADITETWISADAAGDWRVHHPGVGTTHQLAWVPGTRDLLVVVNPPGTILRVHESGAVQTLVGSLRAYGLTMGRDGYAYVTSVGQKSVFRLDPQLGATEVVLEGPFDGRVPRASAFSPDQDRLYIGFTNSTDILAVDLDDALDPVGEPWVFATGVGQGGEGYHDVLAVDRCGALYVSEFYSRDLYRVGPEGGEARVFWESDRTSYAHGAVWGTGRDGWRSDALYLSQPLNGHQVLELVVGVDGPNF